MAATKVLVVDDDLNIQRVLVFALKQEGYEVIVASNGATGVEMAGSTHPDLILMDVAMPRLDGYLATQQIRAAEKGRRVPIIMLSAEASVEQRVKGLRAGADDDIVKPFNPLELMARIKALLARSGAALAKPGADATTLGRLCLFYPAKGGVGNTTIAINAAIALTTLLKRRTALIDEADIIFVVMTADLSCLKNVRLVLETMDSLGYEKAKVQLVLNRSTAYTGINVANAESALGRKVDYQVINEYRGAISALNSGEPFMFSRPDAPLSKSVTEFARILDRQTVEAVQLARA